MLRFLLSGTPGKTPPRTYMCACAHPPLECVQIKHTTRRCKEEKLRYEAGFKRTVLSGSTSKRIVFVFPAGWERQKNPTGIAPSAFTLSPVSVVFELSPWQLHLEHLCVLTETDPPRCRSQSAGVVTNRLLNHLRFEPPVQQAAAHQRLI